MARVSDADVPCLPLSTTTQIKSFVGRTWMRHKKTNFTSHASYTLKQDTLGCSDHFGLLPYHGSPKNITYGLSYAYITIGV